MFLSSNISTVQCSHRSMFLSFNVSIVQYFYRSMFLSFNVSIVQCFSQSNNHFCREPQCQLVSTIRIIHSVKLLSSFFLSVDVSGCVLDNQLLRQPFLWQEYPSLFAVPCLLSFPWSMFQTQEHAW